jgi:hypothetical protein
MKHGCGTLLADIDGVCEAHTRSGLTRPREVGGHMRRGRIRLVAAATALAAGTLATTPGLAAADGAYHTERLELIPVGGETGSGMVINIHPNGPVNGALERYQLHKAMPNTSYDVWIQVAGADFIQTATINTDRHGNGHAQAAISAADLAPFSGAVLIVNWVFRTEAGDAYRTDVTVVTLD